MNRILQLQQDKTAATDKANAILSLSRTENRALTADEQSAFDGHLVSAEQITNTIKAEERMAAIAGNAHTDGPQGRVDVIDNNLDRPWVRKADKTNETQAERRSRVFDGFGEYLKAVQMGTISRVTGLSVDSRLMELNDSFQKRASAAGASEMVPTDGGFLIAPDFSQELLMLIHETGLVYPLTRKLPLSEFTNAIKIPAIDEQSRKDGFRFGGVQCFWENEGQQLVGSKPTFALLELITKKLTGLYYATNELLADSRLLGAVVMQAFGEEMGFKLDDGVIRGTGAGQLAGILTSPSLITVPKVSGQANATFILNNVQQMWARLWNRSRLNAVWLINQDVEPELNNLNMQTATGGTTAFPVYLPPGVGTFGPLAGSPLAGTTAGFGRNGGTLYGRPVITIEQAATLGTPGDVMLVDLQQFLMIDKGPMQAASSMHVRFLTDEMTYRWIYRTDGAPWWKVPILPAQGTNTLSPFIALAQR